MPNKYNSRYSNGNARRTLRDRFKAMGLPCAICGEPIDYELTLLYKATGAVPHPMRFELDEIVPFSKGGDPYDFNNLQPTHRKCNRRKSDKSMERVKAEMMHEIERAKELERRFDSTFSWG